MHDTTDKNFHDYIAYNLRRAAEERGKAAEAMSERDRLGRIEMAEIFEARADTALTVAVRGALTAGPAPVPASGELLPTLH